MPCNLSLKSNMDLKQVYEAALLQAKEFNATITGSFQNGAFSASLMGGKLAGHFTVESNVVHVVITKKPIMLPCSIIKKFLENHLTR